MSDCIEPNEIVIINDSFMFIPLDIHAAWLTMINMVDIFLSILAV